MCVCNPKNEDKLDDEFIYIDLESVEKGVLKSKNIIHLKNAPSRAQRILYKNDILFQSVSVSPKLTTSIVGLFLCPFARFS